jgi:hypothetical protein
MTDSRASGSGETPDQALNLCLDNMESTSTLPFAQGVGQAVFERTIEKFRDPKNEAEWPTYRERVLHAGKLAGRLSDVLARFRAEEDGSQPKYVEEQDAFLALKLVKQVCQARVGVAPRFRWCPDG